MEKRYLIFVSSTFDDLKEERRKVMEQILNIGHMPVGMELFQASNTDQWNYIRRRIESCDYYVLIVGERYGSEDPDGVSYTEKEFNLAVDLGIPVSAHLISEDARTALPQSKVEFDKKEKVNFFRAKCQTNRLIKYWSNADQLANNVGQSLHELFKVEPRVGLVRADQGVSPQLANELARLSEENATLRKRLEEFGNEYSQHSPQNVRTSLQNEDLRQFYSSFSIEINAMDVVPVLDLISRLYMEYPNGFVFIHFCLLAEELVLRKQDGTATSTEPAMDLINKLEALNVLYVQSKSGSGVPYEIYFGNIGLSILKAMHPPSDILKPNRKEVSLINEEAFLSSEPTHGPIL